jgi:hypothetical protein
MTRAVRLDLPSGAIQLVPLEDLTARTARIVLALQKAFPYCPNAREIFLRLIDLVEPAEVEAVRPDHRKPDHPLTFEETNALLHDLIPKHQELLVAARYSAEYSKDTEAVCPR